MHDKYVLTIMSHAQTLTIAVLLDPIRLCTAHNPFSSTCRSTHENSEE